jgi:uncharacterized protein YxjI
MDKMDRLAAASELVIAQKKEWGEIVVGFETKNKYVVLDPFGNELYAAVERKGSVLARLFLRALRPFTIEILDLQGTPLLRVQRPFRFYFHEAHVEDAGGKPLGTVRRRFALIRRLYDILDGTEQQAFELFGPILHPWTFRIRKHGTEDGKITKKWSGALKEAFSDADNFAVQFPQGLTIEEKALFLGAVFLIDFVHFENRGN